MAPFCDQVFFSFTKVKYDRLNRYKRCSAEAGAQAFCPLFYSFYFRFVCMLLRRSSVIHHTSSRNLPLAHFFLLKGRPYRSTSAYFPRTSKGPWPARRHICSSLYSSRQQQGNSGSHFIILPALPMLIGDFIHRVSFACFVPHRLKVAVKSLRVGSASESAIRERIRHVRGSSPTRPAIIPTHFTASFLSFFLISLFLTEYRSTSARLEITLSPLCLPVPWCILR